MAKANILEFKNITKTFLGGSVIANNNISLNIEKNEIHSLIGENGSGKSTLMSILFGLYKQDFGKILLNGIETNMYEQGAAKKHKIGMVHQHFHLINEFTVLDNIILGQEEKTLKKFGFLSKAKALERFQEISTKYSIKLDPEKLVRTLSVGDRQKVEIFKVLWESKDIIIFDEPTSTLSVVEIEQLMLTIKKLKEEGKTIIFISHKMKEVKAISDRISILRKGKLILTRKNDKSLTPELIAKEMIGELVTLDFKRKFKKSSKTFIQVKNLTYLTSRGFKALDNVTFDIKKGEIFGLIGIEGNGQEEIIEIIAGLKNPSTGSIRVGGRELLGDSIFERNKLISHIPADRMKFGIIGDEDLLFNSSITMFESPKLTKNIFNKKENNEHSKFSIVDKNAIKEWTNKIIIEGDVQGAKTNIMPIRDLSGGNQQKFVISREINRDNKLVLAGHPTRGLDIKAIKKIYENMISKTEKNDSTILLYSLELSELISVCDRAAVMYHGRIIDIIDPKKVSINEISQMMIGHKKGRKYE